MIARHAARALLMVAIVAAQPLRAQTDYYNTDRGRPLQIEDAYVTGRYNLELKVAPLRLELPRGGGASLGLEPELAYGILPRTQVEIGVPFGTTTRDGIRRSGVAGLSLSFMHTLNAETEHWPALALRADMLAPIGALARDRAATSLTGLLTRSYGWGRLHANSQYTFGSGGLGTTGLPAGTLARDGIVEVSRWITGFAVDHTLPLRSILLAAELYGRAPLDPTERVDYTAGAGVRYQATPMLALDAGAGRRLSGAGEGWYVTFGSAYSFGLRRLFPGGDWGPPP
jgi:hypothetical protein